MATKYLELEDYDLEKLKLSTSYVPKLRNDLRKKAEKYLGDDLETLKAVSWAIDEYVYDQTPWNDLPTMVQGIFEEVLVSSLRFMNKNASQKENGEKGGRPKKTQDKPKDNPEITQEIPKNNPENTQINKLEPISSNHEAPITKHEAESSKPETGSSKQETESTKQKAETTKQDAGGSEVQLDPFGNPVILPFGR